MTNAKGKKLKSAGKDRVFSVSVNKGAMETVHRSVALEDCAKSGNFTEETILQMLDNNETIFSDEFYYSAVRSNLEKWETVANPLPEELPELVTTQAGVAIERESEVEPESKVVKAGETVAHVKKGTLGEVVATDGKLTVVFTDSLKGQPVTRTQLLSNKWRKATMDEFLEFIKTKETAIAKVEEPIQGEAVISLSAKERTRLEKLEATYDKVDDLERHIPFEKGKILNEIRTDKLYRDTHNTMEEYVFDRFGITREYAQNLMQIAEMPELMAEAIGTGAEFNLSVNAANVLMRDSNKIAAQLGLGRVEYKVVEPILKSIMAVMVSVAPVNTQGEIEPTTKFIAAFNDVIKEHLTTGLVEVEGEQMTVASAAAVGKLNNILKLEVSELAAEQIRSNWDTILTEVKDRKERQQTGVRGAGQSNSPDVWKGNIPTLEIICSKHGDTEILLVAVGKLQTRCGCRWHISSESGELVAYEVETKRVVL